MGSSKTAPVKPATKVLRLQDAEILQLYCHALKEAGKEADWRGIDDWSAGDVHRLPGRSFSSSGRASPEEKEWREGLELLGQAFALRERAAPDQHKAIVDSLQVASDELLSKSLVREA